MSNGEQVENQTDPNPETHQQHASEPAALESKWTLWQKILNCALFVCAFVFIFLALAAKSINGQTVSSKPYGKSLITLNQLVITYN